MHLGRVFLTVGVPGSGKTTWAKSVRGNRNKPTKLVSRDELRLMLDGGYIGSDGEAFGLKVQDEIIRAAVCEGHNIIVHNTSLEEGAIDHIYITARTIGARLHVVSFLGVDNETCRVRNRQRPPTKVVPEDAMLRMCKLADNMRHMIKGSEELVYGDWDGGMVTPLRAAELAREDN